MLSVGVYEYDRCFQASALVRNLRTFRVALLLAADYKLNWKEGRDIHTLHQRNADRLYNLIITNKGMYVKLGQSIAIQGHMLPVQYREKLSLLFDKAPQDEWQTVERLLENELGCKPDTFFAQIDHNAHASASIAQVHKARLRTGENVAVKILHANIERTAKWDFSTYQFIMKIYEHIIFKIPLTFISKFISDQLMEEIDFRNEQLNAERIAKLIESDNQLAKRCYVPKTYPEFSTKRLLLMEWIDGVSMVDTDRVKREHYDVRQALTTILELMCKETFHWGFVHCDPHQGNWLVRRIDGRQQVVMLDHGLYQEMSPMLRKQYCSLWNAIIHRNTPAVASIVKDWGFGNPEFFASATMLQSYNDKDINEFQRERATRDRLNQFLRDSEKMPMVLIFIGRAHRILQGVNRLYEIPVNRIKVLSDGALSAYAEYNASFGKRLWLAIYKRFVLMVEDFLFWSMKLGRNFMKDSSEDVFDGKMVKLVDDVFSSK